MTCTKFLDWSSDSYKECDFLAHGGFVAVVMNYNKKGIIARAVDSAFAQDFPCYEIYCMDDASTDDSCAEMIGAVELNIRQHAKETRGLRVVVTKNVENQQITGQWNNVVQMSRGKWFGMFAGDDISYSDRISTCAELVKSNSHLLAVCTNMDKMYSSTDFSHGGRYDLNCNRYLWDGADVCPPRYYFFGCSAFWNRELFCIPLERNKIDDARLFARALVLGQFKKGSSICWALDKTTVAYSMDTGITNSLDSFNGRNVLRRAWHECSGQRKWYCLSGVDGALQDVGFDARFGCESNVRKWLHGAYRKAESQAGTWFQRLDAVINVFVFERRINYGGRVVEVRNAVRKAFVCQLFGLYSWVLLHLLKKWLKAR